MTLSQPDSSGPLPAPYRKLSSLFGTATAALGLFGLSGWILKMPLLASIRTYYIPMAPLTAIIFVCLGGLLLVHSTWPSQGPVGILAAVLSALLSAYGLIELVEYLGIPLLSLEEWLFPDPPMIGAIPTGRMSPLTAALVFLSGAVVPILFLLERKGERQNVFRDLAGCLGLVVALTGTVFLLGYLHGTPLLYGTLTIPMAATTALAFLLLGTAQVLAVGPDGFPSRLLAGPSARARLLRVFVSTTVGVVVAVDLMHVYAHWIFFEDNAFMSGVSTTAIAVVTGALIARIAFKVGEDMDRSEEARKRTEKEMRISERRFRDIADHAQEWVWEVDAEGKYTYSSRVVERFLGYTPEEMLQRHFHDSLHPEDRESLKAGALAAFAAKQPFRDFINRNVHRNGQTVWLSTSGIPMLDEKGNLIGYRGADTDITERKRAEAEKAKLQDQLLRAQKMEAVGRLAGGVAHDFNNLLTVITGYSELLLQKIGKESPMHGELEEIRHAGERAASLTKQLLTFSRKQIIEPKVLDLNFLMINLGKMLVRLIGENIDLKTVPGKGLGLVKVDPGQFEQVLVNLAVNARDAMPDGGTLLIETANVELDEEYCAQRPYEICPGRFVRLAVSDTGHGMAEEIKKKIFEPFFTTKEKGKGTGLGLSMIYGAVKQSGGSIEAYSEVGKGTTIKIYLPRVEGEIVELVKDDRPTVLLGGTETVLVTEDEEIVRAMCSRILGDLGYKVLQAGAGDEAIALAAGYGERIDLLMTDIVMPGINGRALATQLVLHRPKMKVLFTSGYTDDAIVQHGVLDEGVSFIGKPYTPSALAKKIREVLDKA